MVCNVLISHNILGKKLVFLAIQSQCTWQEKQRSIRIHTPSDLYLNYSFVKMIQSKTDRLSPPPLTPVIYSIIKLN